MKQLKTDIQKRFNDRNKSKYVSLIVIVLSVIVSFYFIAIVIRAFTL